MDVWVGFIGVEGERISVLTIELLAREISHRPQHLVGWCSRRHREHELVDQLRWLSAFGGGEGCLTAHLVHIEVPVIEQRSPGPAAHALAVVGFEIKLPVPPDVVEMFTYRLEVIAVAREHLHNRFRRSLYGSADLLDLCRGEVPTRFSRASAAMGDQIEKRLIRANPKGLLGHVLSPSWSRSR